MHRRIFLLHLPSIAAAGAASLLGSHRVAAVDPQFAGLRERLDAASRNYDQARNLLHTPWRYEEAKPLLGAAMEDAAQVWLRLRGIDHPYRGTEWAFTACNVRDETSGVAWNAARVAINLLDVTCVHVGRWERERCLSPNTRGTLLQRARAELIRALDAVAQCVECTRHALRGSTACLPPLPPSTRI